MGPVARLVASSLPDPGVMSFIPAQHHTFVEIDHEIISTVILPFRVIQEGCCQLQTKVYSQSIG